VKTPTGEASAFAFDSSGDTHFESLAKTNGRRYWYARDLLRALGYDNWANFKKTINKAIGACTTLNISVAENFIQCQNVIDGRSVEDLRLSRFACCLAALNGDPKKPQVALAQVYFISLAQVVQDLPLSPDSVDRLVTREEISEREITLSKVVAAAGVEFYDRFQNAGYRGMYNMDYGDLKRLKGIPEMRRSLLDFMGKEELAGNLFRLALTEGRIKRDNTRGQAALQNVAEQVGRRVRQTMIDETGIRPEDLPIAADINIVKKGLKGTNKGFGGLDDIAKERLYQAEEEAQYNVASLEAVPGCPECLVSNRTSHFGSPQCTSGSLASGGRNAHCACDYCAGL